MDRKNLETIIESAIKDEIESYEFYRDAAEKVKDSLVKDMFSKLSKEELEHRKFLENFLESEVKTINLEKGVNYKISESIYDKTPLTTDMNFKDAIKLAMKKEESAMNKYEGLAGCCSQEDEKQIFLGLRDMEEMHKNRLEEIYLNVAYTEVW